MPTIKKRKYAAKNDQEQEILTLAHKVSAFYATYKKQFVIAAAAIIAILVIIAGYSLLRSQQEQKAAPLVAIAYEYYSPASGVGADYSKALGLFRDIQKKYSGTMSGSIAQYYIGNCLVNLGQLEDAIKEYGVFVSNYSSNKFLLGLVYQRMGYAYNNLGKSADAIKAFEQSEAAAGPSVATVELARLYEASGNIPESQKKYKLVMDRLGGTSWAMEAMGKVQSLSPVQQPAAGKSDK
jgi:tetratricopeptide (TPR) repeat protein